MNFFNHLSPYRLFLFIIGAIGFFGLNGVFLFYALVHPEFMSAALENPISLVFILEAFLMTGFVAWLISKLELKRPGWLAFTILSMVGSLAFSIPSFLLLHLRKQNARKRDIQHI